MPAPFDRPYTEEEVKEMNRRNGQGPGMTRIEDTMPKWQSLLDEQGNLPEKYKLKAGTDILYDSNLSGLNDRLKGINLNTDALQELRSRSRATGPSAWAKLAEQKQAMEQSGLMDNAAAQARSALSAGYSGMARRGGASAGARAQLARGGMRDFMNSRQGVQRQGASDRLGIMTQDEAQKTDILKALPGMEVQALAPDLQKANMWSNMAGNESRDKMNLGVTNRQYATDVEKMNLGTTLGDIQNKQKYEMDRWGKLTDAWAAERQAQATENADGGLTYLCTMANACIPFTRKEWDSVIKFREWCMEHETDKIKFYLTECSGLPVRMKEGGIDPIEVVKFTQKAIALIDKGDMKEAADFYWDQVVKYIDEYWSEINSPLFESIRGK